MKEEEAYIDLLFAGRARASELLRARVSWNGLRKGSVCCQRTGSLPHS